MGTTVFSMLSSKFGWGDPSRIAAGIVTGIGFLGAGVILQTRGQVTGLTTAATIWYAAALGMGIGLGQYYFSFLSAAMVLAVLLIFPYVEFFISKFHEITHYEIKCGNHDITAKDYEQMFKKNKLRVLTSSQAKKDGIHTITWKLSGGAKNHLKVKHKLIDDKNLIEFTTF